MINALVQYNNDGLLRGEEAVAKNSPTVSRTQIKAFEKKDR